MRSHFISTLICLIPAAATAQKAPVDQGLLIQSPLHRVGEGLNMPSTQVSTEARVSRATLRVRFHSPEDPSGYEENATAFQIAPDLAITNRHVVERLVGAGRLKTSKGLELAEARLGGMELASEALHLLFRASKIAYCSQSLDFCLLRLAPLQDGRTPGELLESLKPYRSLDFLSAQKGPVIGVMGNMNGEGIQTASDRLVQIRAPGLLLHCVPTTSHESGGNSGSPVFDASGNIVGIDAYSLKLDSGCKKRAGTTGGGISSEAFLRDLLENRSELYLEIQPL